MKTTAVKIVNTKELSREDWLLFRTRGIGGSDVAPVLNISPWKQPLQVYMEKTGQWESEDLSDKEAIIWGNILESVIAKEFSRRNPNYQVQNCNYILQKPDHPFMIANIDRSLYHPQKGWGVLEIKTANARMEGKWTEDEIPYEYILQIQHYLAVTGLNWGYVAVLLGGQKYKQYYIEKDQELINILIEKETDFWINHVEALEPPMADVTMDCTDLFNRLFPSDVTVEDVVDFSDSDIHLCIDVIEDAKEKIKAYEKVKEINENIIKDRMREFEKAKFNGGSISWKYSKPSFIVDSDLLKTNYPDIYEQVKKEKKQSRMFKISKK